jgi:hypothetical protein
MKLVTILKWSTNLTKCFGYFPLRWNKWTVCRYGPIGDKIVSITIIGYGAFVAYMALESLSANLKNIALVKDAINNDSLVGLVAQVMLLFFNIAVTNAELIFSVAHRGCQMEFLNNVLTAESEFTRSVSTTNANLKLLVVFIIGGCTLTAIIIRFQIQMMSHPKSDILFLFNMYLFVWPDFGIFVFKLNLLLYVIALNQRFDLLTQEIDKSIDEKYKLFSIWQDCVTKLNKQHGLQFGWILLFDFLMTLVMLYLVILHLILRESDFEWRNMTIRCILNVTLFASICWSAGQLSEKVGWVK